MEQINTTTEAGDKKAPVVTLGFAEAPWNSLLVGSPRLTPSKLGGKPVWLCPLNLPSENCQVCGVCLVFLGQVVGDLPEHFDVYRRMLYIFVCASKTCCNVGRAFAYRCMIQEKNEWVQFATNDDFSNLEKAYDEELETTGYGKWLEDLESQYASEEETKTPANKEVAKIVLEEF
jgi:hypothetical protein